MTITLFDFCPFLGYLDYKGENTTNKLNIYLRIIFNFQLKRSDEICNCNEFLKVHNIGI